jgi:hypothetical protein
MRTTLERLRDAMSSHDAHALSALIAGDDRSAQPVHPGRGFGVVVEGRLYMEPVEDEGGDIVAAVQELYRPPPDSAHRPQPRRRPDGDERVRVTTSHRGRASEG